MTTPAIKEKLWPEVFCERTTWEDVEAQRPRRRATGIVDNEPSVEKETLTKRLRKSRALGGKTKAGMFRKSPPSYEGPSPTVDVEQQVVDDEGAVVSSDHSHDHSFPATEPLHEQAPRENQPLQLTHDIPSGELNLNATNTVGPTSKGDHGEQAATTK